MLLSELIQKMFFNNNLNMYQENEYKVKSTNIMQN